MKLLAIFSLLTRTFKINYRMNLKFAFFTICLTLAYHSASLAQKDVKIMTWNIWHGGLHGSKTDNFVQDTANTVNVRLVIEEHDPDILFMQETYCCGMDLAAEAGYPYNWQASSNLSIHSKYPIVDTLPIFKSFNSQGVIIDVEGTKLMCFNIWLHYLPDYFKDIKTYSSDSLVRGEEATRLKEITAILAAIDSLESIFPDIPIVIGGDFNSGSHLDWIESTKEYHYGKVVEWPVSRLMMNQGFRDSFREVNPDPLKTMEGTWGFLSDDIISDRIDYIYSKGKRIHPRESKIVMDDPPGGFFNSDHRAILTLFSIGK